MTRLPQPYRVDPALAAEALKQRFDAVISLPDHEMLRLPQLLADAGVSAGAAYDGSIAATAADHDAQLVSLDRRAQETYERCRRRCAVGLMVGSPGRPVVDGICRVPDRG